MPPQTALRQGRQKIKPASRSEIEYVRISEEEVRTDEDSAHNRCDQSPARPVLYAEAYIRGGTAGAALRRFAFIKNEHPETNGPAVTPGRVHCLTS